MKVSTTVVDGELAVRDGIASRKGYYYLGILWLLFFFDIAVRTAINPLLPLIKADLALSDGQLGLIGSAVLLGITIFVIPISYVSDRWSRSRIIGIMAFVWSACSFITGCATGLSMMLGSRLGVGVGEASYSSAAVSLISTWFEKSRWGKILAVFNSAQPIAGGVGIMLAGVTAVAFGWRATIIAFSIPSVFLGFLALRMPKTKAIRPEEGGSRAEVAYFGRLLTKNKTYAFMCLANGVCNIALQANITWTSTYLVRYFGFSVSKAAILSGLVVLIGIPAYALGGLVLDRWYKRDVRSRMWFAALAGSLGALSFFAGYLFQSLILIFAAFFFMFAAFPVATAIASQELVPSWRKTAAYGITVFASNLFGFLGPMLVGRCSDICSLKNALASVQILLLLGCVGFLAAGKSYKRDLGRARIEEAAAARPEFRS
jgi:MFS family permease